MDRLPDTLLELGLRLRVRRPAKSASTDVDGDEYFVDLLLFHTDWVRYSSTVIANCSPP